MRWCVIAALALTACPVKPKQPQTTEAPAPAQTDAAPVQAVWHCLEGPGEAHPCYLDAQTCLDAVVHFRDVFDAEVDGCGTQDTAFCLTMGEQGDGLCLANLPECNDFRAFLLSEGEAPSLCVSYFPF